ncbi:MAG: hypothetical protein HYX67_07550 [Candidatus Melainabacteria bacterium]|nr:hypothetical protein [Candidatus Melainabacteria bacterium]
MCGLTSLFFEPVFAGETELENSLRWNSQFAPGIIGQGIRASHYFFKTESSPRAELLEPDESPQPWEKKSAEAMADGPQKKRREFVPFIWSAGFGYQRNESPAKGADLELVDQTVSAALGLKWDINPFLRPGVEFLFDSIAEENYGHGAVIFSMDVSIPLRRRQPKDPRAKAMLKAEQNAVDEYDPDDALQYFKHEQKIKERQQGVIRSGNVGDDDVRLAELRERASADFKEARRRRKRVDQEDYEGDPSDNDFMRWKNQRSLPTPYLKISTHFSAGVHGVGNKTFRRNSLAGTSAAPVSMSQFELGTDLILFFKPKANYTVGVNVYGYNSSIDGFVQSIEADVFRRQPIYARDGISGLGNQNWSFPSVTLNQKGEWRLGERALIVLEVAENFYLAPNQPTLFLVNQTYSTTLGTNWRGGVSALVGFGGVASPLLSAGVVVDFRFD